MLTPSPLRVVRVRAKIVVDGVIDSALGVAALGVLVLVHGNGYGAILAFGVGAAGFFVLTVAFGLVALRGVRRGRALLEPLPPQAVVRSALPEAIWGGARLFTVALLLVSVAVDLAVVLGYGPGASLGAVVTIVAYRRIERTTGPLYMESGDALRQRPLYYAPS